jgi:hypothetical protein
LIIADKSSSINLKDSLKLDISIININNNYETKLIKIGKKSINEEMTEKTHGKS